MTDHLHVQVDAFSSAGPELERSGLLGFLTVTVGGSLVIDSIALRRTRDGRLVCSYPERHSGGRRRAVVRPKDDRARRALEAAILAQLGLGGPEGDR